MNQETLRALSCAQRNLLSTQTHVSLLVCTRRKAGFPQRNQPPLHLCLERRVGEKQRRVPPQRYLVLFYQSKHYTNVIAQLTEKYLVSMH